MEPEETQIVETSNGDHLLDKAVSSLVVPLCLVYRRWRADILRGGNNCCKESTQDEIKARCEHLELTRRNGRSQLANIS